MVHTELHWTLVIIALAVLVAAAAWAALGPDGDADEEKGRERRTRRRHWPWGRATLVAGLYALSRSGVALAGDPIADTNNFVSAAGTGLTGIVEKVGLIGLAVGALMWIAHHREGRKVTLGVAIGLVAYNALLIGVPWMENFYK